MFGLNNRCIAAVAAGLVAFGYAATPAAAIPTQGEWELVLLGSGSSDQDFDAGGFSFTANANYYFTDQWQLGVSQTFGYSDFGDSSWTGGTRVLGSYNFNYDQDQMFVPYVGVVLGYIYGDATSDTFVAGPQAGVKWFVNDTTFIYGSVTYEFLFEDTEDADEAFEDGQFVYALGIGFTFGGNR